jgi:hypothetical protein
MEAVGSFEPLVNIFNTGRHIKPEDQQLSEQKLQHFPLVRFMSVNYTPWSKVLLEKLKVSQTVKKSPAFC